jgi:uncharacterized membrane protein YheB (UPF0754 family)
VNRVILFFIPPVVGCFIGYITNVIAIKLLFRPLKEIRILGVRLPFTPGILPRQRFRLAQSIGGMVERELLTAEIIRQRLARDDVREKTRDAISLFTENILAKSPTELLINNNNFLSLKISEAAEKIYPLFTSLILEFLNRYEIRKEMESKGRILLRNIFLKLNTFQRFFISAGQYDITLEQKMPEIIDELIDNAQELLNDARVKKTLTEAILSIPGKSKNLAALLDIGMEDKKKLDDFILDKLITTVDEKIENILSSIDVKSLVSERIDSLDMLRVERIVLDVMSDQFKWIEIFGGILGFLIGLFQSALALFLSTK